MNHDLFKNISKLPYNSLKDHYKELINCAQCHKKIDAQLFELSVALKHSNFVTDHQKCRLSAIDYSQLD